MVQAMKRPSSPRGRLFCVGLLIVTVLTLLGHVWAESRADAGPAAASRDTHHRGSTDAAHAALSAVALFSGPQSGLPTLSRVAVALLATTPPLVAKAAARAHGTATMPSARADDGGPPLFLLHATFLI
jgi:hypothetical protein